jgi:hypothetical protein
MRKIQSIGQNIEPWERDKVQMPGTKIALERAILDALRQIASLEKARVEKTPLTYPTLLDHTKCRFSLLLWERELRRIVTHRKPPLNETY